TPNLDALRAYGLALRASAIGDSKNENELLQHALELDPGFAAAYLRLAGNVLPWDKAQAFAYFSKAYEHKDRLGPRDQLYIEAWRAMFGDPSEAIEKWHLLAEMYPDFMAGQENMGVLLWQKENRFAQAVAPLKQVAASKHPLHVMAYDLLGHVYLGMNDYQASLKAYDSAQRLGLQTLDYGVAGTYIAMRNYDEAERVLSNFKKPADANFALNRWTWQAVLAADQGHLQQALAVLEEGRKEAIQRKAENFALKFQAMALSLQVAMSPDTGLPADLRDFQKSLAEKLPSAPKHEQAQIAELLVFVAYLDGRIGKSKQAQLALDASSPYTDPTDPVSASLRSLAKAELLDPSEANALLSPLSQGDELCQVHSALLRIAKRQKDAEGIRKQAQWLAANRGRALAEWNDGYLLGPLNLVDADEAVVEQAKSPSAPSGIR
ncbi:MAG TPA: hypothetical protein VFH52_09175, partial [Rhodanobacteraceae bacterium]|nr:hypothetical protein [Rhodanobacteraceae bacterium]